MSTAATLLAGFAQNTALLLSLAFVYSLLWPSIGRTPPAIRSFVTGSLFAAIAVVGMFLRIEVAPGVVVDGRTIVVALAGVFHGPGAGLTAGALVSAYRLWLGGVGALPGVGAILTAMAIGACIHRRWGARLRTFRAGHFMLLGTALAASGLLWTLAVADAGLAWHLLTVFAVPVTVFYPVASVLLGLMLLYHQERRQRLTLTQFSLDHSAEAVFWIDPAGRIADANAAALSLCGYAREELRDVRAWQVDGQCSADTWPAVWQQIRGAGPARSESHLRTKQGAVVPVEMSRAFIDFEGEAYICCFLRDISERKRSEEVTVALVEVGKQLTQTVELDRVLGLVVAKAAELLSASASSVFLIEQDAEGVVLNFSQSQGLPGDSPRTVKLARGEGVVDRAIREGRPVWTADVLNDPGIWLSEGTRQLVLQHGVPRAILAAPLTHGDVVIGGLAVHRQAGAGYTPEEIRLLVGLASHAAIALENARLFQEEQERRRQIEAVRAVSEEIARELRLPALLELIARKAGELVEAPGGCVRLWDEAAQHLVPASWFGLPEEVGAIRLRAGEGLAGAVAQRREGMVVNDYPASPYAVPRLLAQSRAAAVLGEPLLYRDRLLGVISMIRRDASRPFLPRDRDTLRLFAAQAAIAIQNATLYREIKDARDFLRSVADNSADAIVTTDLHGRVTYVSQGVEEIFGYRPEDLLGRPVAEYYRSGLSEARALMRRLLAGERIRNYETAFRAKDGRWVDASRSVAALRDAQGAAVGTVAVIRDITEQRRADEELQRRALQQAAVAVLGLRALAGTASSSLLNEAVAAVAETLRVEYCKVLELLPDGNALLLRAGVGWKDGFVGHATVSAGTASQAGYTLLSNEPVVVEDLPTETRFSGPPLLNDHGVVSGMSVIIAGRDGPFGVLGAHTTQRRTFTRDDTHFLQAIANVLALAIERKRADETLCEMNMALANAMPGISRLDPDGRYVNANQVYARMLGYESGEMIGVDWTLTVHAEDRKNAIAAYGIMLSEGKAEFEARAVCKDGSGFYKHVLMVKTIDADGNFTGHHCFTRDITERKRAEETLQALYRASLSIQEPLALQERLDRLLVTARDVLHLERLGILLADPDGRWLQAVARLGAEDPLETIRVPIGPEGGGLARAYLSQQMIVWDGREPVPEDLRLKPPYDRIEVLRSRAFAVAPLTVQGRAIGVLGADRKHSRQPIEPAALEAFQLFVAQAAIAIQNARLFEQVQEGSERLRALSRRLVEVQESERRSIARELHDEVGQILTALKLTLEMTAEAAPGPAKARLAKSQSLVNDLITRVRDLSLNLRPTMLDDLGLLPALLWQVERYTMQTGIQVAFDHAGLEGRLSPETETAAYRILQEALTNAARHAGVRKVTVRLLADAEVLKVHVEDRGRGFDPSASATPSNGLTGMRERAVLLGGCLTVESAPGRGTRVTAELPLTGALAPRQEG